LATDEVFLVLSRELFESLALGFWNQEGRENTRQHEQGEDLENVLNESVGTTDITKTGESDLGDNSTKLAGSGRDTVGGGTVTGGEDLSRNDKSRRVGAKVLEEVRQTIKEDECLLSPIGGREFVVRETHDDECASEHTETEKLDGLAAPRVDEKEGNPVSRNETGDGKNQVTDGDVVQVVEDFLGSSRVWRSEADGGQDDGGVEPKTVEGNLSGGVKNQTTGIERKGAHVESEPRPGSADQNLSILPLTKVVAEVFPASLGNIDLVGDDTVIRSGRNTLPVALDIPNSLLHVGLDIEGKPRGFWDRETEVKSDNTGDASEANEETPAVVNAVGFGGGVAEDGAFVGVHDDEGNESGSKVAETLGREGRSHHAATNPSGSKLGRDDSRKRVVTTDSNPHDETPYNEDTDDVDSRSLARERLSEGGDNDDHKLNAIHPLTADNISQPTEEELSNQSANGGSDLDSEILIGVEFAACTIDITQHGRGDVDGEDVVAVGTVRGSARYRSRSHDHIRVCEKADTGNQADPYVEPSAMRGEKCLGGGG
jgi:hypothetical protein